MKGIKSKTKFSLILAMSLISGASSQAKCLDDETDLIYYGHRYYSPIQGRWLSRDPIAEKGGISLYSFTANGPIGHFDYLGLCNPLCGVDSFDFVQGSWVIDQTKGQFQYVFGIRIKFKSGGEYDPSACKYVQYANATAALNGRRIKSKSGLPDDGQFHLDTWPWTTDDLSKASLTGGPYADQDPTPAGWLSFDAPGFDGGQFRSGDQLYYHATIRGVVVDRFLKNKPVVSKDLDIEINGTYLGLMNFTPDGYQQK